MWSSIGNIEMFFDSFLHSKRNSNRFLGWQEISRKRSSLAIYFRKLQGGQKWTDHQAPNFLCSDFCLDNPKMLPPNFYGVLFKKEIFCLGWKFTWKNEKRKRKFAIGLFNNNTNELQLGLVPNKLLDDAHSHQEHAHATPLVISSFLPTL